MKPVGKDRNAHQRNQRVLSSRPRSRRKFPNHETASMTSPMPTMMRNVKNGMTTGGRSSGGNSSNPTSREVQLPEAMKLPSLGTSIANRLRSFAESGIAISTSLAGCCVFQRASIAANFAGWCLSTYSPVRCPKKSCTGTSTATSPRPQCSISRASARCMPRSAYHAPVAITHMPVVRKAASSICGQRTRMIGPVVIAHQSAGMIRPSKME